MRINRKLLFLKKMEIIATSKNTQYSYLNFQFCKNYNIFSCKYTHFLLEQVSFAEAHCFQFLSNLSQIYFWFELKKKKIEPRHWKTNTSHHTFVLRSYLETNYFHLLLTVVLKKTCTRLFYKNQQILAELRCS